MQHKSVSCPICGSAETRELLAWREYFIVRCLRCNLLLTSPHPSDEELFRFYQGFLFRKPDQSKIAAETVRKKKELQRLFQLDHSSGLPGKFLDYGGGTGIAYHAASKMGFDTYYYDIDKEAAEFVKSTFGLKPDKFIETLTPESGTFDYIFCDNVIEHLRAPIVLIANLYNHLNPGGVLVMKTPHAANTESFFNPLVTVRGYLVQALKYNPPLKAFKAYGSRCWHCDPPRHLFSFSADSFRHAARRAGIPEGSFEIQYYSVPLFMYTVTSRIFKRTSFSRPKSIARFLILLPVIPFELALVFLHALALSLKLVTPAGIILKAVKQR